MNHVLPDLRYAFRSLFKSPGFAVTAIVTLAAGIAANTAIFSVIDATLLARFALREPDRVIRLYGEDRARNVNQANLSIPKFDLIREQQQVFSDFGAALYGNASVMGPDGAELLPGARISAGFFDALGAKPLLGRDIRRDEEDSAPVMLIGERLWRQRFNASPSVLGQALTVDGESLTIIGVMPTLPGGWNGDIFLTKPFQLPGLSRAVLMRGVSFLSTVGRLKPGVTPEQAAQNLKVLEERYRTDNPEKADSFWAISPVDLREDLVGPLRPPMLTLLGAVGFVLLLACSNVANLMLARFAGRGREVAVRTALGASRRRIVAQFLWEASVVGALAGVLGALLASWSLPALGELASATLGFRPALQLEWPVLAAVSCIALGSGLLTGLLPAFQASRADVALVLRDGGRGTAGSRSQNKARQLLVGGQVALSMLLLSGAALLLSSFVKLQRQPLGFDPQNVFVANITLGGARYPDIAAQSGLITRFVEELRAAPGVVSAAAVGGLPLSGFVGSAPYARSDGQVPELKDRPLAPLRSVTPGYFATMGIPLLAGRDFDSGDVAGRQEAIIISAAGAKKLFPNEDPIGRVLLMGAQNGGLPIRIVGVAGDVRSQTLASVPEVEFYRATTQRASAFFQIAVRTQGDAAAFTATARSILRRLDEGLALNQPSTMEATIRQSLGQQRLLLALLSGFAVLALGLAAIGVYSVVAYTVAQRTSELGVRAALGASPGHIAALTLRDGLRPVAAGLLAGLAAVLAGGRLLQSQLFDTPAWDPVSLSATMGTLAVVAVFACLLPARRAARVDPLVALRDS
jgi:predicted permease